MDQSIALASPVANAVNHAGQAAGYKIVSINFFYNDKPNETRTENALVDKLADREDELDQDGETIELDERVYHFNGYSLTDSEIFYTFAHDEEILGNKGEFTVTSFEVVDENP